MPSLLPARFRRQARTEVTAAVDAVDGSGVGRIPQSVVYRKDQRRAAMYAKRIGFVGRAYRFTAWQAARCILRPEQLDPMDREWSPGDDDYVWAALDTFRGARLSQSDLLRASVYQDDTVGEFFLIIDHRLGAMPTWSVYSPAAVEPKDGNVAGRKQKGYLVKEAPGGKIEHGTARWVPASDVFRHWQPDPEYQLLATSSLMGMLDDLDTFWTLQRSIRRTARSQLTASNILWTPSEAHTARSARNPQVSELEYEYAQASTAALNDDTDRDVASVAPRLWKSPAQYGKPELITLPGVTEEQLAHLQDARTVIADALPLSTSSVMGSEEGNHWNEWLADEDDIEVIEDRLDRVCSTITAAVLRPTLERLIEAGVWDGDPDVWRVGYDTDPLRRRPDNSKNAVEALDRGLIGFAAARREMHFDESDAPTYDELRQILALAAMRQRPSGLELPVAATQAPPADPVPALPAGDGAVVASAAGLPVIDDRWLLVTP